MYYTSTQCSVVKMWDNTIIENWTSSKLIKTFAYEKTLLENEKVSDKSENIHNTYINLIHTLIRKYSQYIH